MLNVFVRSYTGLCFIPTSDILLVKGLRGTMLTFGGDPKFSIAFVVHIPSLLPILSSPELQPEICLVHKLTIDICLVRTANSFIYLTSVYPPLVDGLLNRLRIYFVTF